MAAPSVATALSERRCCRGIDVGHGHEDEQHDPHLVHLAAPDPRGVGMAELVNGLDDGIGEPERDEILGREHAIDEVLRQIQCAAA